MQMTGSVPSVSSTSSFDGRLNLSEGTQEPWRTPCGFLDPTTSSVSSWGSQGRHAEVAGLNRLTLA
jgi:hypothetical protein